MSDVEYDVWMAMVSMVNGTLMAKRGRDHVKECRGRGHLLSGRTHSRSARLEPPYFDFNVLGVKCGPIRRADSPRGRRRGESIMSKAPAARGRSLVQPLELG